MMGAGKIRKSLMNTPSETSSCGFAIWSLVLGIPSILLCIIGRLFGIPAVICGHLALGRIKRSGGLLRGQGPAISGLVTGYISIAMIPVIGLLAAIAIPNFVKARNTAVHNACVNNLRQIDGAKQQWALENAKKADDIPTKADIEQYLGRTGAWPICPADGTCDLLVKGRCAPCPDMNCRSDHRAGGTSCFS